MNNNGKFPPNLQVSLWPKGREAHTDVKEEGEEGEITFENGVAWERTEQLIATYLTSHSTYLTSLYFTCPVKKET